MSASRLEFRDLLSGESPGGLPDAAAFPVTDPLGAYGRDRQTKVRERFELLSSGDGSLTSSGRFYADFSN